MSDRSTYELPLATRYAGRAMLELWSDRQRVVVWRQLWIALARAERELGLAISAEQIAAMEAAVDKIDFAAANEYERRFRHDVMAHIHAFGDVAATARGIIHLGATSCFVTDNADLILMRRGLDLLLSRLRETIEGLADFARRFRAMPTLGFTHFQPAQLTTVGKRACLWLYDLALDAEELLSRRDGLLLRGAKGTTGTQASFLALFGGDHAKCKELEAKIAAAFAFPGVYAVAGQTYSRKIDVRALEALSGVCQSAHKFATDLRLLAHRREMEEPFEAEQIGSSAMAYKRNPMRAERMCGLARFVMNLAQNAAQTHAIQWFERTLDDSANRRLAIPQAFLGTDAVLRIYANVAQGLVVYPKVVAAAVATELPFMATENLLMAAVKAGGDRQSLHERIRVHSLAAADRIKNQGLGNDLLDRFRADDDFAGVDVHAAMNPAEYVGRAPAQVDEFLAEHIEPLLERLPKSAVDDLVLPV